MLMILFNGNLIIMKNRAKTFILYILVSLIFGVNIGLQAKPLEQIVAIVNDSVITQSQLNKAVEATKKQFESSQMQSHLSESQFEKQVLNDLILEELQLQMVEKVGLTVSDEEVTQAISNIAKRNGLSIKAFQQEVEKQSISWTFYRSQIHKQLLIARLQQEAIGQTVNVTSEDIAKFKKQYAAHQKQQSKYNLETIVIPFLPVKEMSSAMQAAKARTLVASLREKTPLKTALSKIYGTQLAKEISPESQQLGLRSKDELPDLFQDVVTKMKVGQYVEPIKAPNGFHILHLIGENKTQRNLTKAEITRLIYQQKFEEALKQWLKGLRSSAYVKIINHKSS